MAAHQYAPDPPIPPELMDQPEGVDDPAVMIDAAFAATEDAGLPLAEVIAQPERWRIGDDGAAEWALRHLAAAETEMDALRERATEWQFRIEAWFTQAAAEPARSAEFFTAHLTRWAREQRSEHGRKSVALPSGKVATRLTAPAAEVFDEGALIGWARVALPGLIRTREDVLVSDLRREVVILDDGSTVVVANESGEIVPVPGVVVRPEQVSVTVKVTP